MAAFDQVEDAEQDRPLKVVGRVTCGCGMRPPVISIMAYLRSVCLCSRRCRPEEESSCSPLSFYNPRQRDRFSLTIPEVSRFHLTLG